LSFGPALITVGEPALIPVWFYSYSAIVYGISALISLIISYFAFRLYRMSSVKVNLILFLSFLGLGLAFLSLTVASIYTYFYAPHLKTAISTGLNVLNKDCYNFYYLISLISYFLLLMVYIPGKIKNKFPLLYIPLWYTNLTSFHIAASALVGIIFVINLLNYLRKKSLNSFLVMFAFLTIMIFHLSSLFVPPFGMTFYLAAHTFLIIGFGSLLFMLIRVGKNERGKKI
jgi:hypothetical protein